MVPHFRGDESTTVVNKKMTSDSFTCDQADRNAVSSLVQKACEQRFKGVAFRVLTRKSGTSGVLIGWVEPDGKKSDPAAYARYTGVMDDVARKSLAQAFSFFGEKK